MSTNKDIYWYRFEPEPAKENLKRLQRLSKDEIWISDPDKFNDPWDLRLNLVEGSDWRENSALYEGFLQKLLDPKSLTMDNPLLPEIGDIQNVIKHELGCKAKALVDQINQRIGTFGVQCFSRNWHSTLSWAHYSSGHRGYVIKYLAKEWCIATGNIGDCHFDNVIYVNQLPQISLAECIFAPHETLKRVLATKHAEWAYESEVRLVHYSAKGAPARMPHGLSIHAFMIGANATCETERRIVVKAKKLKVAVEYAAFQNGTLQLVDRDTWQSSRDHLRGGRHA